MDDELARKLDAIASVATYCRKTSPVKSDECPVWDHLRGCWMESDAQLRVRIRAARP